MFNTLSEFLDPRKHHVHVALRDQHIQESPNHNNPGGGIHPVGLKNDLENIKSMVKGAKDGVVPDFVKNFQFHERMNRVF